MLQHGCPPAPMLLGFVLGPRFEENFRRAMLISRGDLLVFVERPISAFFVILSALLILTQIFVRMRANGGKPAGIPRAAQGSPSGFRAFQGPAGGQLLDLYFAREQA